ncbi:MAG: MBL fold metallo-hydrolase [Chloroflexi bacterium]|nr:MBL fold metallo-hydrolase [Chloroflexota bacterium]
MMQEIAKGIYIEDSYHSGNVGCVLTGEGAVLIDCPMLPRDAWDWLRKITAKTKKGITFLINTDCKVERVLGNCFIPATATIAHQQTWAEIQRYDEAFLQRYLAHQKDYNSSTVADLAKARIVLPELTMTVDMTIYKEDRVFRLLYAEGHTPASIMVHLPEERILFTGDVVVNGEHPSLAQANTLKWLHALEMIRKMDNVDLIVPGFGKPCDLAATEELTEYISQMRERVYECYRSGYTRRETVDRVRMEEFFSIPPARREVIEQRIRSSVQHVYDEFKKAADKKR